MRPFARNSSVFISVLCVLMSAPASWAGDALSPLTMDLGGGVKVTPYGYVKLDAIRDDGYKLGKTTGPLKSIGTALGPEEGSFGTQTLQETRIGFDVSSPDVFARFEGDFYGVDGTLRLRHAYVQWGNLIIGQNWTNFMLVDALASTVDFTGAGGLPFARTPQVRLTLPVGSRGQIAGAIERDIANSDDPAFTLAANYKLDLGEVHASAIYRDTLVLGQPTEGWGVNLATVVSPWNGGTLKASLMSGDSVADYLSQGWVAGDISVGSLGGKVDAAVLSVTQQVTQKLKLAATGSWIRFPDATGSDTGTLKGVHLSAFYDVGFNTTLMGEVFFGDRKQGDGDKFSSNRLQLAIKYSF